MKGVSPQTVGPDTPRDGGTSMRGGSQPPGTFSQLYVQTQDSLYTKKADVPLPSKQKKKSTPTRESCTPRRVWVKSKENEDGPRTPRNRKEELGLASPRKEYTSMSAKLSPRYAVAQPKTPRLPTTPKGAELSPRPPMAQRPRVRTAPDIVKPSTAPAPMSSSRVSSLIQSLFHDAVRSGSYPSAPIPAETNVQEDLENIRSLFSQGGQAYQEYFQDGADDNRDVMDSRQQSVTPSDMSEVSVDASPELKFPPLEQDKSTQPFKTGASNDSKKGEKGSGKTTSKPTGPVAKSHALPSWIPREYFEVEHRPIRPDGDQWEGAVNVSEGNWEVVVFPSGHPASRKDVIDMQKWYQDVSLRLKARQKVEAAKGYFDYAKTVAPAMVVHSVAMHEIIRQTSLQCTERANVLSKIWTNYGDIVENLVALVVKEREEFKSLMQQVKAEASEKIDKLKRMDAQKEQDLVDAQKELENVNQTLRLRLQDKDDQIRLISKKLLSLDEEVKLWLPHFDTYRHKPYYKSSNPPEREQIQIRKREQQRKIDASFGVEHEVEKLPPETALRTDVERLLFVDQVESDLKTHILRHEQELSSKIALEAKRRTDLEKFYSQAQEELDSLQDQLPDKVERISELEDLLNEAHDDITRLETELNPEVGEVGVQVELEEDPNEKRKKKTDTSIVTVTSKSVGKSKGAIPPGLAKLVSANFKLDKKSEKHGFQKEDLMIFILDLYKDKVESDKVYESNKLRTPSLVEFLYDHLMTKYGLQALAEQRLGKIVKACEKFREPGNRVHYFERFCGFVAEGDLHNTPDIVATYSNCLRWMRDQTLGPTNYTVDKLGRAKVLEDGARGIVKNIFKAWPDTQEEMSYRVKEICDPPLPKTAEVFVDGDALLHMILDEYEVRRKKTHSGMVSLFIAADVNYDGVLEFDEFKDCIDYLDPNVDTSVTAQMFKEALELSKSDTGRIQPETFADVLTKQGLKSDMPHLLPPASENTELIGLLRECWKAVSKKVDRMMDKLKNTPGKDEEYEQLNFERTHFKKLLEDKTKALAAWYCFGMFIKEMVMRAYKQKTRNLPLEFKDLAAVDTDDENEMPVSQHASRNPSRLPSRQASPVEDANSTAMRSSLHVEAFQKALESAGRTSAVTPTTARSNTETPSPVPPTTPTTARNNALKLMSSPQKAEKSPDKKRRGSTSTTHTHTTRASLANQPRIVDINLDPPGGRT